MKYITVEELLTELEVRHPDKMLLDNFTDWERGKLAGKIELIEEIKLILEDDEEEEDE